MTPETSSPRITITTPSDRELRWVRSFRAPISRVFAAITEPEYVKRWLLGPEGWSMPACEIDLRPGGRYRYVWRRDRDGKQMGMGGVFQEVTSPSRVTFTETFDEAWYSGHAVGRYELHEERGVTVFVQTMQYESSAVRDEVLRSGLEDGIVKSHQRLDALLLDEN